MNNLFDTTVSALAIDTNKGKKNSSSKMLDESYTANKMWDSWIKNQYIQIP